MIIAFGGGKKIDGRKEENLSNYGIIKHFTFKLKILCSCYKFYLYVFYLICCMAKKLALLFDCILEELHLTCFLFIPNAHDFVLGVSRKGAKDDQRFGPGSHQTPTAA